jgi:hypothetical protein
MQNFSFVVGVDGRLSRFMMNDREIYSLHPSVSLDMPSPDISAVTFSISCEYEQMSQWHS